MTIFRLILGTLLASSVALFAQEPKKPTPRVTPNKETTYVTEPLDDDGYIDYEAVLNKLLKGISTPETNAVVLLVKAFGPKPEGQELHPDFYKALGVPAPPADGAYWLPYTRHFKAELGENAQEFDVNETRLRRGPWKPDDSPRHVEWLKANEKPLALVVEASKRKDYFHPMLSRQPDGSHGLLIGALLSYVQKVRETATALSLRATLKLGEGKFDDALQDALTMHRLSRLVAKGGSLIELLVGIALHSIAHNTEVAIFRHGTATAEQALAYQRELLALSPMSEVAEKLTRMERISFLDSTQSITSGKVTNIAGVVDTELPAILRGNNVDFEVIARVGNSWYDRIETALRKPTRAERVAATEALEQELKGLKAAAANFQPPVNADLKEIKRLVSNQMAKILVGLMMPAAAKVSDAADRSEQMRRNGLLLTALAAFRADKKTYPDKLSELAPKYIAQVPEDVFAGKPLVYRKTDKGYLFYGVGQNGKDDGGTLLSDEPRGDDIGVRMTGK